MPKLSGGIESQLIKAILQGRVQVDHSEAFKWYKKAADSGNDVAQDLVGFCYLLGSGIDKNVTEGLKWIKKASDQGYDAAQGLYRISLIQGKYLPKDQAKGVELVIIAAEKGDVNAQSNLGRLYLHYKNFNNV